MAFMDIQQKKFLVGEYMCKYIILCFLFICSSCIPSGSITYMHSFRDQMLRTKFKPQTKIAYCDNNFCLIYLKTFDKGISFITDSSSQTQIYILHDIESNNATMMHVYLNMGGNVAIGKFNRINIHIGDALSIIDAEAHAKTIYSYKNYFTNYIFPFNNFDVNLVSKKDFISEIESDQLNIEYLKEYFPDYLDKMQPNAVD